MVDYKL